MAELRSGFVDKTDDEIIQVLRSYAPGGQGTGESDKDWFLGRLDFAKRHQAAVEGLRGLPPGICYDYQIGSSICRPEGEPRAPSWLRDLLGDDFFANVVGLGLSGMEVNNQALEDLGAFPNLEFVMLSSVQVDDDGLACLCKFPRLKFVEIRGSLVTRNAMEALTQALPEGCVVDWNHELIRGVK